MTGTANRPLIGVTTGLADGKPRLKDAYFRSIETAGGNPVLLFPGMPGSEIATLKERLGGLVLSGGGDVDPSVYGETRHPRTDGVSAERDTLELGLTRWSAETGVPLFAICRGIQVLNVALGGTLVQDIPSEPRQTILHDGSWGRDNPTHRVAVEPGSLLASALGTVDAEVNSFHHQAVRKPGRGLKVVATAPDGLIEGVEMPGARAFLLGVQWHPEEMTIRDTPSQALFRALVTAASAAR